MEWPGGGSTEGERKEHMNTAKENNQTRKDERKGNLDDFILITLSLND